MTSAEISRLLDARDVHAVYQPICDLLTGRPVAFEALGRGPAGSALESPGALFPAAERLGRLAELDWMCRAAAYAGALAAGLGRDVPLFVNTEPVALDVLCPPDLRGVVNRAEDQLRVVSEFTERELADRPAALLTAVAAARACGWAIALDDVGAEPLSLGLLPFVRPEVVKLDLRLVQRRTDGDVAGIVSAVLAYAEKTGAVILAEGIETEEHRQIALTYGATLGQGWLFGRPGPLPSVLPAPGTAVPSLTAEPLAATPYEVVAGQRPIRRAEKRLLLGISHHLENAAYGLGGATVVLSCFQDARHFTTSTKRRYRQLTRATVLVAALGTGMPARPVTGVRGAELAADDALRDEWTVVVVSPHYAGALVGRDCGDGGAEPHRRFDYCVTHDRRLVLAAARSLLSRVVPVTRASGIPAQGGRAYPPIRATEAADA